MRCSAERLIDALVSAQMLSYQHQQQEQERKKKQLAKPNVVTVSRECGSLGQKVARMLAEVLEVRCCDRIILQEVARRAHVDESLLETLDSHLSHFNEHWWEGLLHKDPLPLEEYHEYLVKTVVSISRMGGVIMGRGAHLILGRERAFRVRITGSLDHCAAVISKRDHLDIAEARSKAIKVNKERTEYIRQLYNVDINDMSQFDLLLNSDRFSTPQMVELILDAMELAGYTLPHDARQTLQSLQ